MGITQIGMECLCLLYYGRNTNYLHIVLSNRKRITQNHNQIFFSYVADEFSGIAYERTKEKHKCLLWIFSLVQFSSVAQSCPTLCDPMNCSTPGLLVHHHLPQFTQTHVHRVGDAIQPSHPLSSPFSPAPNPSQHQGLFQWVNSSHEVAKVLEFQL